MPRPYERTYTPSEQDVDYFVSGGSGAALTLLQTSMPDGLAHVVRMNSSADLSGLTFTVTGIDQDGKAQTETITGPNNGFVESDGYYETVSSVVPSATTGANTINVGFSDEFTSPTMPVNHHASEINVQALVTGTIDYTLQQTLTPLSPGITGQDLDWINCTDTDLVGATASQTTGYDYPVTALRVIANSYSAGATMTFQIVQANS